MVIADETPNGPRFQAFLAPQSASRKSDFRTFLVSVKAVERATGLNFHHELPDDLEAALEKNPAPYWLDLN
jgi:endonuclease G